MNEMDVRALLRTGEPAGLPPLDLRQAIRRGARRAALVRAVSVATCVAVAAGVVAGSTGVLPIARLSQSASGGSHGDDGTAPAPGDVEGSDDGACGAAGNPSSQEACGRPGTPRELVRAWIAAADTKTVALPLAVPQGYRLVFAPGKFAPAEARSPVIDVCTLPAGADPVGECIPTIDPGPWFAKPTDDGQWQVVVSAVSKPRSDQALDPWRSLTYTANLDALPWFDEPLP
jgi:hypothetical protein